MKFYTFTENPENALTAYLDYTPMYLVHREYTEEESAEIIEQTKEYRVIIRSGESVEWDLDSSRNSDSEKTTESEVPNDTIIIKDGAFFGYFCASNKRSGGFMRDDKYENTVIVATDGKEVLTYSYSVSTGDYSSYEFIKHKIVKKAKIYNNEFRISNIHIK